MNKTSIKTVKLRKDFWATRVLNSYKVHRLLSLVLRFKLGTLRLRYLCHPYNGAYLTERTVEVSIVKNLLAEKPGARILEVGNVLSHFFAASHDIVDKYEKGPGVINSDILEFAPNRRYDRIVSISTIEHIGWDEDPAQTTRIYINGESPEEVLPKIEPQKIVETLNFLCGLLSPEGFIVVTIPVGYNPYLDNMIENKTIAFDSVYCIRRKSWLNTWVECTYPEAMARVYNEYYPWANAVLVGIMRNKNR